MRRIICKTRPKHFTLLLGFLFLYQGCATIERHGEQTVPEKKPQVSKTLIEEVPKRFLKRKVAIARFSNETKYGQSFFLDENRDWIGKQAMDILSARLAETDRFIMLERADIEKIDRELEMGNLSILNIPADYLIVGSVSEFGRKTTGEVGIFSRTKRQTAYARVNIRLIDVYTGQIIYSEEGEGEAFAEAGTVLGVGGRAGYDASINDKAISAAISKLVSNVIENLLDKPWRSYVLSYQDGNYIIAGGKSQGIRKGDIFEVHRKGKRVINPQTKMAIELPSTPIGKIKVHTLVDGDPTNEVCLCTVVAGDIPRRAFENIFIQEPKI
jgi:curli biogenesis system outer membrane secretion channel CsgG